MKTYKFQRLDTGEIVEVDFATMMEKDCTQTIWMDIDGKRVSLKQIDDIEFRRSGRPIELAVIPDISDNLGFADFDLRRFEKDRVRHGFSGVEFIPDPRVDGFYKVKFSGPEERKRYEKHRGYENTSGINGSGAALTQADLDRAAAAVKSQYPVGNPLD